MPPLASEEMERLEKAAPFRLLRKHLDFCPHASAAPTGTHGRFVRVSHGLFRKNKLTASQYAVNEILYMKEISLSFFDSVLNLHPFDADAMKSAEDVEQHFDEITEEYRKNQLERLQSGVCSGEACILYSELLTDFERIGDHILNIAQALSPQKAKT